MKVCLFCELYARRQLWFHQRAQVHRNIILWRRHQLAVVQDDAVDDVSAAWTAFTEQRVGAWTAARAATTAACGAECYGELLTFYSLIRDLLAGGAAAALVQRRLPWCMLSSSLESDRSAK